MIEKAWEELSEREADILRLREQRVTLSEIAAKYGISNDRVRQISVAAKRKLRDAQRKILTSEANQKHVPTDFTRSDLILIEKALRTLQEQRSRTVTHALGNLADIMDNDPLYYRAEKLKKQIEELLTNTRADVLSYVEDGLQKSME